MEKAFPKFIPLQDLGLYAWQPGSDSNTALKKFKDVTSKDILPRLDLDRDTTDEKKEKKGDTFDKKEGSELDELLSQLTIKTTKTIKRGPPTINYNLRFPIQFRKNLPKQQFPNSFPNDAGYIVPLFVAIRRGLSLADIDFVLGGSALEVLAHRRIERRTDVPDDTKYMLQKVADVIFIVKSKKYVQDYADVGFQFERLVTGGRIEDQHDNAKNENLHLMEIGGFRVLFSADVDAVDDEGNCVEIKSGNPKYFGTKVLFQMISSGAKTLVQADKRGPRLMGVNTRSIVELVAEHRLRELQRLQDSIIEVLVELKKAQAISEDEPTELDFVQQQVALKPCANGDVLPKKEVVKELLDLASKDRS